MSTKDQHYTVSHKKTFDVLKNSQSVFATGVYDTLATGTR